MESQDYSKDIKLLTYKFVQGLMERTKGNLQDLVPFDKAYDDACYLSGKSKDEYDGLDIDIRYHVRDNLLTNDLIFIDPKDVDSIYITQKAIDKYNTLPMEKW